MVDLNEEITPIADEPENHTIALLREMRTEMRERFDAIDKRFDAVDQRFAQVEGDIGKLAVAVGHLQGGQVALLDLIGKQTRALDEVALRLTLLEQRVSKLEPERV